MKEKITQRFKELIEQGDELISRFKKDAFDYKSIDYKQYPAYQSWMSSASNLIHIITQKDSPYLREDTLIHEEIEQEKGINPYEIRRMLGLLISAQKEWSEGLLREIEYIIAAETFDDFLDHADLYHKGKKKVEASILASAVLEDAIKKIAKKNSIESKGKSLEPLINEFVKAYVFTPVKAKRIKAYAGTRTKALHAEWDEFDIKDVGEMIKGIRELVEDFL